ncbi:MAG: methylenetetrahydrofolate--tRNA-(uracil(54)-C(5))-methyltransferase (FADH(2)-oxidizing) TrmFO [Clostridia bacterium]|nr:methylenetetrahydrofolate--tRNA-(uracil(54)-C(5))-methyltransferase (FADH(2)-oxidizing) TrmFO [Clostridia bacterium]
MTAKINVIGAGLAGCEAAWQAAEMGALVTLYEMKPSKYTPAHHHPGFAELVCSNSLRSRQLSNAVGLLKAEMSQLGSLIMEAAYAAEVPAGAALAVDRHRFSDYITKKIRSHPRITVVEQELTELPSQGITVVASGPLTSDALSAHLAGLLSEKSLSFFDAAAPIVDASTINMEKAYLASRYGKGEACYINCPMNREEYTAFYEALISAPEAPLKEFDKEMQSDLTVFEGCMPVEVMAKRGFDTLLYGPLKPVGLPDPKTGKDPFAVIQLRQENLEKTLYNLVGFQTHLTFEAQKRIFRMIPGLENAEFTRYGVMHRNTFLDSPRLLDGHYRLRKDIRILFAGQMTGVEGYLESAASGYVAGVTAALDAMGKEVPDFSSQTAIGALAHYVSSSVSSNFQPMNVNFGIIDPLDRKVKGGKAVRNEAISERALTVIRSTASTLSELKQSLE